MIGVVVCEAGCSLQELDYACSQRGLYFPMDYHLREALIGGVLAADIGGPRTVRYGTLHGNVLGVEVVSYSTLIPSFSYVSVVFWVHRDI